MAQLEGNYPIRIGGETTGTLSIGQEGLMTVFSADCRDDGELIRLSVFDEGGNSGYLGVMLPVNGRLSLIRRLSRTGLRGFPETISYAGIVQETDVGTMEEKTEMATGAAETEQKVGGEKIECSVVASESETSVPSTVPQPECVLEPTPPEAEASDCEKILIWKIQPNPWSLFSEPRIKAALRSVRGALTATEEGAVLLAIPMSLDGITLPERIVQAGETREIDGKQYVVFRL